MTEGGLPAGCVAAPCSSGARGLCPWAAEGTVGGSCSDWPEGAPAGEAGALPHQLCLRLGLAAPPWAASSHEAPLADGDCPAAPVPAPARWHPKMLESSWQMPPHVLQERKDLCLLHK